MRTLIQTLNDSEEAVLSTIASTWGFKERPTEKPLFAEKLADFMLTPENAEKVWVSLPDDQRQALQTLLGGGGKMQMSMFKHMFGDVRKMGRGAVEREQPHKSPKTTAEALFYKGLMGERIQIDETGSQMFAYVPDDLMLVLPKHKTAYDDIERPPGDSLLTALDVRGIDETRPADTSIVDDMTTLLAFVQLHTPPVAGDSLQEDSLRLLMPYLLTHGTERLAFMVTVGVDAGLLDVQNGHAHPHKDNIRQWLDAPRSTQLETLIRAWISSELYRELHHVPGLTVEDVDGYDPRLARRVIIDSLKEAVPASEWWDIDEFLYKVREIIPDFQRPNGDYDSWYILDAAGEYVRGFDSWDTVEGALLEFIILRPMHWLGLNDAAPEAARLTAYGRGVIGVTSFPKPPDEPEPITLTDDGLLFVSRKVSRKDRYQIARFTTWEAAPPLGSDAAFTYKLDRAGVKQALAQDIQVDHITSFLNRVLNGVPIPEQVVRVLGNARGGGATSTVTLEEMIVLQTTSAQVLDELMNDPNIRRFFRVRFGDTAAAVRREQWAALRDTLEASGMGVQLID